MSTSVKIGIVAVVIGGIIIAVFAIYHFQRSPASQGGQNQEVVTPTPISPAPKDQSKQSTSIPDGGMQVQQPTSAVSDAVATETADWRTYRNASFGFEVKYPPEWNVVDELGTYGLVRFVSVSAASGQAAPTTEVFLRIGPRISTNELMLGYGDEGTVVKMGRMTIGGVPADMYFAGVAAPEQIDVVFTKGDKMYKVSFFPSMEVMQQTKLLLSTFRFIQ